MTVTSVTFQAEGFETSVDNDELSPGYDDRDDIDDEFDPKLPDEHPPQDDVEDRPF